jgi:gliding motility-associated-like protein
LNRIFYAFLMGLCFFMAPSVSHATHIVGGDMTYRFVEQVGESNRYIFKLNIYYDCFPLDGQAANDSDSTITIAVYQQMTVSPELWRLVGNNGGLRMITVRRSPLVKITNPTFECLVPPTNICVFQGVFEFELILKRIAAPYSVSYQRCCRNNTINNLVSGGSTGATFYCELTPEAQRLGNSSPAFSTYPPTIACINEPFESSNRATDPDGDRLVYRFCPPLSSPGQAGRPECYVSPNTGNYNCPPPYRLARSEPNYPYDKPMYGEPLIKLDSFNGRIAGTPVTYGGYVVSVCVEEYRGNVLIGRVFRDFQTNIVYCPKKVETLMPRADSTLLVGVKKFIVSKCDSTTITLINESRQVQYVNSFYWEFNINGQTRRFSDWSPRISFPDTGYYRGVLWINKGEICYDSAFVDVIIGSGLKADFKYAFDSCSASPVVLTNTTAASYFGVKSIRWDLIDTVRTGLLNQITHNYTTSGFKTVKLTLTNRFGCTDDTIKRFSWQPLVSNLKIDASNTEGCAPTKISFKNLTVPFDTAYKIKWELGDGTTSTLLNPTHIYTREGTYPVKLTVANAIGCQISQILRGGISIHPKPKADFDFTPKAVNIRQNFVRFTDLSSSDVTNWSWTLGSQGYSNLKSPTYTFKDTGFVNLQLIVANTFSCADTATKSIYVEPFISYFLPTSFTPNYDGLNDEFAGAGYYESMKDFTITLTNRWGEVVFQSKNPAFSWNGKVNNVGRDVQEGVYNCVVNYTTFRNEAKIIKQFVTVLR